MEEISKKVYDLEERTYGFTRDTVVFCKKLPKNIVNIEYIKQVVRSAASVGANYIEANEALGSKDFKMRIKICRKEAKESVYWFKLIMDANEEKFRIDGDVLCDEANQLKKIFSAILEKSN